MAEIDVDIGQRLTRQLDEVVLRREELIEILRQLDVEVVGDECYMEIADKLPKIEVDPMTLPAYAAVYGGDTLVFGRGDEVPGEYGGKSLDASYRDIEVANYSVTKTPPWYAYRGSITAVDFIEVIKPTSTCVWFYSLTLLKSIKNIQLLDTSNVANMSYMFDNCYALTSLDVSDFDTSNVTNMTHMFEACKLLTHIDVSNFDTSKVTSINYMFNKCSALASIDVGNFDTSKISGYYYGMEYMFGECSSLTSLDLSNFNTSNVGNMNRMFYKCSSLKSVDLSSFDTGNVNNMSYMFYGCSALTSLDVANFNTANVTDMTGMFSGCSSLTSLDVTNFDLGKTTKMSSMFAECSSLDVIRLSKVRKLSSAAQDVSDMFNGCTSLQLVAFPVSFPVVTNMLRMFNDCSSLTSIHYLTNVKTSNVTNMNFMFNNCSSLASLDLSKFDTSKVTGANRMFNGCGLLTTIYAGSKWALSASAQGSKMFTGCTKLKGGAGTIYNSTKVDKTYARIDGGTSAPGYFTAK